MDENTVEATLESNVELNGKNEIAVNLNVQSSKVKISKNKSKNSVQDDSKTVTSTVKLIAIDIKTKEELYSKDFDKAHAERILSIENTAWKLAD